MPSPCKINFQQSPLKKKKTPNTVKTKNDVKLPQKKTLLSLHPMDSSGTEDDDMSINSNKNSPRYLYLKNKLINT